MLVNLLLCLLQFQLIICLINTDKLFAALIVNQGVYSRSSRFDGNLFQILTVQEMVKQLSPPGLWLNIQVNLEL